MTKDEQIVELMQRGMAAARAGQRTQARPYFATILELDPTHQEARLALAAVLDDAQEAMAHLAHVLTLNPGNERARAGLRVQRRNAGNLPPHPTSTLPAAGDLRMPIPRPLRPLVEPQGQRPLAKELIVGGLVALMLVLGLILVAWSDAPRVVMAALLPTATPTSTPTATPTPTFTATPTPTNTATPTPTFTPTSTPTAVPTPKPTKVSADKSQTGKWIEIDLSAQKLYAHEGQETVLAAVVSTGTWRYPTVTGRFEIYAKYRATRMSGPGYNLPNVPYTMFFYGGYAIHGTYWHNNFGTPMSHGCVNMKTPEARWLFNWAPKGTLVVVHR
jgi:lipoprotein-anchoring transpeptidase ErfK/SrfK